MLKPTNLSPVNSIKMMKASHAEAKTKNQIRKIRTTFERFLFFFPFLTWCYSRKRVGKSSPTLLLWLHSIYFSSICKCLQRFPSGSETVCPFFFVTTLRLPCSVCLASQLEGINFSSALETDFFLFFTFPGKRHAGHSPKTQQVAAGLTRLEHSVPFSPYHLCQY